MVNTGNAAAQQIQTMTAIFALAALARIVVAVVR